MSDLFFIQPHIIDRLTSGQFVAKRKSNPGHLALSDRRSTVSPLAVTKRCIKYDYRVFENRRPDILAMVDALNSPHKKLVMLKGAQGCGKTSLMRGVIEMMGGGDEQVLWFDASPHTDTDDVISFLLNVLIDVSEALQIEEQQTIKALSDADRFEQLDQLLQKISDVPLLVVMDNLEYLVTQDQKLRGQPLKDMLNFLLSFKNIKLILCGESLPASDINPQSSSVCNIQLSGLSLQDLLNTIAPENLNNEVTQAIETLYPDTQGTPWLLKILRFLIQEQATESIIRFSRQWAQQRRDLDAGVDDSQRQQALTQGFIQLIWQQLPDEDKAIGKGLSILRHPVTSPALALLMQQIENSNALEETFNDNPIVKEILDDTWLSPLMKRTYAPQEVLYHIQNRHLPPSTFQPSYEFYRVVKASIYRKIPASNRQQLHQSATKFYISQRNYSESERLVLSKTRFLTAEAQHHEQHTLTRKTTTLATPLGQMNENAINYRAGVINPKAKIANAEQLIKIESLPVTTTEIPPLDNVQPNTKPIINSQPVTVNMDELELTPAEKALIESSPILEKEQAEQWQAELNRALENDEYSSEEFSEKLSGNSLSELQHLNNRVQESLAEQTTHFDNESKPKPVKPISPLAKIQQALAKAISDHNKPLMMKHLNRLGRFRVSNQQIAQAQDCYEKVISLYQNCALASDKNINTSIIYAVDAWMSLAEINEMMLDFDDAENLYRQAFSAIERLPDRDNQHFIQQGKILFQLGELATLKTDHQEAISLYKEALQLSEQTATTEPLLLGPIHFKLAQAFDFNNEAETAIGHYTQSLKFEKHNQHWLACAAILTNLGTIYFEHQLYKQAITALQDSFTFDSKAQNIEGQLYTLDLMGKIHGERGDTEAVTQVYQQALALAMSTGQHYWKSTVYLKLGYAARDNDNMDRALGCFLSAQAAAKEADLAEESIKYLNQLVRETETALAENSPLAENPQHII